jgi:hypothetical protein
MKNLLIVILLFSCPVLYSQEQTVPNNVWISCGAGMYQQKYFTGASFNSSLNFSLGKHFDTIAVPHYKSTNIEFRLNKYIASYDEDNYENLTEIGLLYGISFGKNLQVKFASGVGLLSGSKTAGFNAWSTPQYEQKSFSTVGIPLVFGINVAAGEYFGLGIDSSINFYSNNTIFGVNIRLLLGKIY